MKSWVFVLFMLPAVLSVAAVSGVRFDDPSYDEFEGLDLAQVLIRDGRHDEAERWMARAKFSEKSDERFLRLSAEIRFARGDFEESLELARAALDRAPEESRLETLLLIAESLRGLGRSEDCAQAFARIEVKKLSVAQRLRRAECERSAGRIGAAWRTYRSSEDVAILKARWAFFLELGLVHEAEKQAFRTLSRPDVSAGDLLGIAEVFDTKGRGDEAFHLLEAGRIRFPLEKDILLAWAQLAYRRGLEEASAEAFALVALTDPKYYYHAAEIHRQLGKFERSRFLNRLIPDGDEKLKQSVALGVDQNRWDLIAGLEGPLSRSELIKSDEISYALAYSLIRIGAPTEMVSFHLDRLSSAEYLAKAQALRQALDPGAESR